MPRIDLKGQVFARVMRGQAHHVPLHAIGRTIGKIHILIDEPVIQKYPEGFLRCRKKERRSTIGLRRQYRREPDDATVIARERRLMRIVIDRPAVITGLQFLQPDIAALNILRRIPLAIAPDGIELTRSRQAALQQASQQEQCHQP